MFDIPNADPVPLPKPLASYFEPGKDMIDVYLAVPAWRYGNVNVATGGPNADTRYLAEVVMLRDKRTRPRSKNRYKWHGRISVSWWIPRHAKERRP